MPVILNKGKHCSDNTDKEIHCTLTIDVSDAIDTCGYRALELARRYCATAEAYHREGRWWFTWAAIWFAISAAIWFAM
ncbi:hypothetical protein [Neisseria subflava]|uniref:hypothetical protein n=1 Tax=Neisseria subflava TaxID=28449 RepID=UPI0027DEE217|nr:hypothetical protein [Neisseria subflava]